MAKPVFRCALTTKRYFYTEADNANQMMDWLQTHSNSDVDNLTKNYIDIFGEEILDAYWNGECKPDFSITT